MGFFGGRESQAYLDDPAKKAIYDVNPIANYDSESSRASICRPGRLLSDIRPPAGSWPGSDRQRFSL